NLGRHIKKGKLKSLSNFLHIFNQETPKGALNGIRACSDPSAKSGEYYGPDGFYNTKGFPVVEKSTKRSHSLELQNTLWEHSVKITNLDIKL
ncbi:MAG: short-chain dehydrogenase, partial [Candidatus Izimaplasma sp.]|nr:short-chain dehydrogenase [Candidatus Izimaplasma bacterium]